MSDDDDRRGDEDDRKERVLHTRVPLVLEQELKRLAASLKLPVSNIVRSLLEEGLQTVDTFGRAAEGELRGVADRLERQRDELRRRADDRDEEPSEDEPCAPATSGAPLAGVVGFQPLWLAREESCRLCGRAIARGERAFLGVRETPGARVVVGEECLPFTFRDGDG